MRLARRILFWFLFTAFTGVVIWWGLYIPHRPRDLYRAIPAHASFVSAHHNIAARWDVVAENPVTRSLLLSLGLDDEGLLDGGADPVVASWLRLLASRETVIAYVPQFGPDAEPTWVFASWLGGESQRLRWMLYWSRDTGIEHVFDRMGHHIWAFDPRMTGSDKVVSFSLVEGMLVGSISRRAATTAAVLECFDGVYPTIFQTRSTRLMPVPDAATPDRGWFNVAHKGGILIAPRATYDVSALSADGLSAAVRLPWPLDGVEDSTNAAVEAESLGSIFGGHPVAVGLFDRSLAEDVAQPFRSWPWVQQLRALVADLGQETVGMAITAGDLSGRFRGIRLPTLYGFVPTGGRDGAELVVKGRLDALNALTRWGLIPQELLVGTQVVYAVQSTAETPYTRFPLEEQVAYTAKDGWLVLGSNAEGLTNLLSIASDREAGWLDGVRGSEPARVWIDLERGAKAIRIALTAYALKLVAENPETSQPMRQRINEWKAWVDAMAPLGELRVTASPAGEETEIRVQAGRSKGDNS